MASVAGPSQPACAGFDIGRMRAGPLARLLFRLFLYEPQWWMGLLRRWLPICRLPFLRWAIVTRYEDVREVLAHDREFPVPFEPRMKQLTGGRNFVLGMADGAEYRLDFARLAQVFPRSDVPAMILPWSRQFSEEILARSEGRIDVVADLLARVPARLCERYYGVPIPDQAAFVDWTLAMSGYLFGAPSDEPSGGELALAAADCFREVLDAALARTRAGANAPDTVLARLVALGLDDETIRAQLFGMIVGFIPTNLMAAGNALEVLATRPRIFTPTREAALAGDDDRLRRCLLEAMRFKPINPGPFRLCSEDYVVAAGTPRAKTIRKGTRLLVSMQSAMFDERAVERPRYFDPARRAEDYMLFGYGQHWCIGAYIAQTQITQTFKALLRRKRLRPAAGKQGKMQRLSLFPAHLVMEFDP